MNIFSLEELISVISSNIKITYNKEFYPYTLSEFKKMLKNK